LSRSARFQKPPVTADDIADVGIVAPRLEIADMDDRAPCAGLDLRNLTREVRRHEDVAAARALVIERARADDRHPIALEVLISHEILSDLADRVWREWPKRIRLGDGHLVFANKTVLLTRSDRDE